MILIKIDTKFVYLFSTSDEIKKLLIERFSVEVPNFWMAKQQMIKKGQENRARAWNGRKNFISGDGKKLPVGLLQDLIFFLTAQNLPYRIIEDTRTFLSYSPDEVTLGGSTNRNGIVTPFELYPFQQQTIQIMAEKGNGIILVGTGGGKCLHPNTKVLLYDGTIKEAKDIIIGDSLMGDDSTPRTVLALGNGVEEMYEVIPIKGESYIVNKSHILCLKLTNRGGRSKSKGKLIEVSVEEYLKFSKKMKHITKGYRVPVMWDTQAVKIDPYFLGLWLGDGKSVSPVIYTADKEIVSFLENYSKSLNMKLSVYPKEGNKSSGYAIVKHKNIKNPLETLLKRYNLVNNKHIPMCYKINSRNVRLQLLAGLIDSDGYVHHNFIEITLKIKKLIEDIAFVARSLGFAAYIKPVKKTIKTRSFIGEYYKVSISGDLEEIPTILLRKRLTKRLQKKNVLVTGIQNIKPLGVGAYCGFTLNGNGKFLLADFTVTHNTEIFAGLIKKLNTPRTLFLTHRNLLSSQTVKRLEKRLEIPIGLIEGTTYNIQNVTVGMIPTLYERIQNKNKDVLNYLKSIQLALGDEIHLGTADSWVSVFKALATNNIYGGSGTPFKNSVIDDMKLVSLIGQEIFKVPTKWLIDNGYLTPPILKIVPIKHNSSHGSYAEIYKKFVVDNMERHELIKSIVERDVEKQTLLLVNEISHGEQLYNVLKSLGAELIHSKIKRKQINEVIDRFSKKELNILISTPLLDVGVDIPVIDRLLLCNGSGKAITSILQRIGRSLRISDGKVVAEIFDIVDMEKNYLYDHFKERLAIYSDENQQFKMEVLDIGNYIDE